MKTESVPPIEKAKKERLGLAPKTVVGYQSQVDTMKSSSSTTNRFAIKEDTF